MSHPSSDTATASSPTATSERWAMSHLPSHLRLGLGAALGVVADLWSKEWAFEELQ